MKKQKPTPQKPSGDRMTLQEVKTQWLYHKAHEMGVRLCPERRMP